MAHNKKALILVDVQQGFNTNDYTQEVIEKMSNISPDKFDLIIATKFTNDKTTSFSTQLGKTTMMAGDTATKLVSEVSNLYDISLPKNTYSAADTIADMLETHDGNFEAYIAGFDTDGCVLATALGLFDRKIETYVVESLCASSGGDDIHQAAMAVLERSIGRNHVINTL